MSSFLQQATACALLILSLLLSLGHAQAINAIDNLLTLQQMPPTALPSNLFTTYDEAVNGSLLDSNSSEPTQGSQGTNGGPPVIADVAKATVGGNAQRSSRRLRLLPHMLTQVDVSVLGVLSSALNLASGIFFTVSSSLAVPANQVGLGSAGA